MRRGTYLSREAAIGAIEELRKDPRAEGKQDKIEKILLKYGADEDDTDPDEGLYASMYTNDIRNAYEDILDLLTKNLVDVYVQVDSSWKLLYEQIPEDIAHNIWQAGFATGENKISIETETSKRLREYNKQALRGKINSSTNVKASKYYEDADTYVVSIWHEVEGMRGGLPSAAQEIFEIVADSPDEALERAKMQWKGPIDRIEIIDVNPEDTEEDVPFNAATTICADTNEEWAEYLTKKLKLDDYYSETLLHDLNNGRADEWLDSVPEKDKADFAADFNIDYGPISFKQWVAREYGEDFDLSGISDAEYYDLEDTYREEVPAERREKRYR